MIRKLTVILLCFVMIFSITGCGGSQPAASKPANTGSSEPIKIRSLATIRKAAMDLGFKEFMRIVEKKAWQNPIPILSGWSIIQ